MHITIKSLSCTVLRALVFVIVVANAVTLQSTSASAPKPAAGGVLSEQVALVPSYGRLPLGFEANTGQLDGKVKYFSRASGFQLYLTDSEAVLALHSAPSTKADARSPGFHLGPRGLNQRQGATLRLGFQGASKEPRVVGSDPLSGKVNYFIGSDKARWRTDVPTYRRVRYENIYKGIDLDFYGKQGGQLEYDFILRPGAEPSAIVLAFKGADRIRIDESGDLVIEVGGLQVIQRKPVIYQEVKGVRTVIPGAYTLLREQQVGFVVGPYSRDEVLVIDPVLEYSTYLGGSGDERAEDVTVDVNGNAYVTGFTFSDNFFTPGAYDTTLDGDYDVFVTKLNSSGSAVLWSTYIGGSLKIGGSQGDQGTGIILDAEGNVYLTGATGSTDFPVTAGAFNTMYNGHQSDAFVLKLDASGSTLIYSTFLGGGGFDVGLEIALDTAGNPYVCGVTYSDNFPTSEAAFDRFYNGNGDCFVTKLNNSGSALLYSTFLGGSDLEQAQSIVLDGATNAYVAGLTRSSDFPFTSGAYNIRHNGDYDVFVTKLNAEGSSPLIYSTFIGGRFQDEAMDIAIDTQTNAYITGYTLSDNYPTTEGAYDRLLQQQEVIVTKLNASGSALIYSTFIGNAYADIGYGIAVDGAGNAYLCGTAAPAYPVTPDAFDPVGQDSFDGFFTKLNSTGSQLLYSTFIGGDKSDIAFALAIDAQNSAYVVGMTQSLNNFPFTAGAYDVNLNGVSDAFVAKISVVLTITANDAFKPFGAPLPAFTAAATGLANGDTIADLAGTLTFSTPATATSPVGTYSVAPSGVSSPDYTIAFVDGTLTIVPAQTTTVLASNPNPASSGQAITLTATVGIIAPGAGTPGSFVQFFDGTTLLGSAAVVAGPAGFSATLVINGLASGTHSLTAHFNGDAQFSSSDSAAVNQTVNSLANSTVTNLTSPNKAETVGSPVTITANVTPLAGGGTPTGTVQFFDGSTLLDTIQLAAGSASLTIPSLIVGTHLLSAVYSGDATYGGSQSSPNTLTVYSGSKPTSTSISVSSSPSPASLGEAVTFTVDLKPLGAGTPTGDIQLVIDGTVAGKVSLTTTKKGGTAIFVLSTLSKGVHVITAQYLGNAEFDSATSAAIEQIIQ